MTTQKPGPTRASRADAERSARHLPWIIAAGLTTVVVLNLFLVYIAVNNPATRIEGDTYEASLRWDEVVAEQEASRALGWRVDIVTCRQRGLDEEGRCAIELEVFDRDGQPVDGLEGTLSLERADDTTLDRDGTFTRTGEGQYEAKVELGRAGLYQMEIRLEGEAGTWVSQDATLDVALEIASR